MHIATDGVLIIQMAEYRISIYGRKQSEWDQLASWIVNNELYSENVTWLIQVSVKLGWYLWKDLAAKGNTQVQSITSLHVLELFR